MKNTKTNYANYSIGTRTNLLKAVFEENLPIKKAAENCGINQNSAKFMIKTFQCEGRIGKKKNRLVKGRRTYETKLQKKIIDMQAEAKNFQNAKTKIKHSSFEDEQHEEKILPNVFPQFSEINSGLNNEEISIKKEESFKNPYYANHQEFLKNLIINKEKFNPQIPIKSENQIFVNYDEILRNSQLNVKKEEIHQNHNNFLNKDEQKNYLFDSYKNNYNQQNPNKIEYAENSNDFKYFNSFLNEYFDNSESMKSYNLKNEPADSVQNFQTLSTTDLSKKSFDISTLNMRKNEKNVPTEESTSNFLKNGEINKDSKNYLNHYIKSIKEINEKLNNDPTKNDKNFNCKIENTHFNTGDMLKNYQMGILKDSELENISNLFNNFINRSNNNFIQMNWLYNQMVYMQYMANKAKQNEKKE